MKVLLDTSAYSAFKRDVPEMVDAFRAASEFAVSSIVLGELIGGFVRGGREARNRADPAMFLASPNVWQVSVTSETAERFAQIRKVLLDSGTLLPTNDMWIAASAMEHGLWLLTSDAHFRRIPLLPVKYVDLLPRA